MLLKNHKLVRQTSKEPDNMAKLKRNADNMAKKWRTADTSNPPHSVEQHETRGRTHAVKNDGYKEK